MGSDVLEQEIYLLNKEIDKLKKENERLKQGIKHYQRGMFKIISVATECRNSKQWNYDNKQV